MPDATGNINKAYRSVAVSADGKKLYCIGDKANVYEFDIATGAYDSIDNVFSHVAGDDMISGSNCIDTMGNMYVGVHGSSYGPALLKINLGKDRVKPLVMPDDSSSIDLKTVAEEEVTFTVFPNPVNQNVKIRLSLQNKSRVKIDAFSIRGEKLFSVTDQKTPAGIYTLNLQNKLAGRNLASGIIVFRMRAGERVLQKKVTVFR